MEDIYSKIFQYEKENNTGYITEIAIFKTTILGRFLLENTDMTHIIDENQEVTYEKVVNAFNIAIFENNMIAEEILPLFQGQVNGTKEELTQIYSEEIVTYILENPSFELYLEKQNGMDARATYVVYENGEYKEKTLGLELKEEIKSADQHHFTKKSYEIH